MKKSCVLVLLVAVGVVVNVFGADKKFGLELSIGFGLSKPSELHYKASGVDQFIHQYAQQLGAQYQSGGQFVENLPMIPVSATALYQLGDDLYLRGGLEVTLGSQFSEKSFDITAEGFAEQNDYTIESRTTAIMPFVGIEKRFSNLGVYALVGFSNLKLKTTFQRDFAESSYSSFIEDYYEVSGSAASFVVGANYRFRVGNAGHLVLKLEYLYSKISELSGERRSTGSSSAGETVQDTIEGIIYTFRVNVYNNASFYTWEMFEKEPTSSWVSDVAPLALDLSSIRFLVGFSF